MSAVDKFPHNFFISCAGMDKKILRELPDSETIKHSKTGILLLFTGAFAACGGGYFYYLIFGDLIVSIFLGIMWGLFFFVLDRAIVSDTKVSLVPEKNKLLPAQETSFSILGFLRDFIPIIIRVMVALVSATIVSKSIELRIFQHSINKDISDQRIKSNKQYLNIQDSIKLSTKTQISGTRSILDKYKEETAEIKGLRLEKDNCDKEYANQKIQVESEVRQIESILASIVKSYSLLDQAKADREYVNKRLRKEDINAQLTKKKKDCDLILSKLNNKIQDRAKEEQDDKTKVANEEVKVKKEGEEISIRIKGLEGQRITADSLDELLPRKYAALDKIQKQDPALGQLGMWLFFLFLGIELSPILRKLLMPKSSYDYKLESEENMLVFELKSQEDMLKRKVENSQKIYDETLGKAEIEEARMKIKKDIDYKQGISHIKDALDNFHVDLSDIDKQFYTSKLQRIEELEKALKEDEKLAEYIKSSIESYNDLQMVSKNQLFENFKKTFLK
jgi:Domain of unknown function (DUF4407)